MKPPICFLCHLDFRHDPEEGGLVYFSLSEDDIEYNNRFKQHGFTGHPAGCAWFCSEHYEQAKQLEHLTLSEALKTMKENER